MASVSYQIFVFDHIYVLKYLRMWNHNLKIMNTLVTLWHIETNFNDDQTLRYEFPVLCGWISNPKDISKIYPQSTKTKHSVRNVCKRLGMHSASNRSLTGFSPYRCQSFHLKHLYCVILPQTSTTISAHFHAFYVDVFRDHGMCCRVHTKMNSHHDKNDTKEQHLSIQVMSM